jgi:ribosomal protein S18 acetylase RimI-like enzyme
VTVAPRCRLVTGADLPAAGEVLTRAFGDDPLMRWLFATPADDPAGSVTGPGFFVPAIEAGRRRGHTYVADGPDGIAAAAVWGPPEVPVLDERDGEILAAAIGTHGGDGALARFAELVELGRARHPDDRPHFYLFLRGAAPPGRGAGAVALRPVLERCDADGLGAYLESSNPRNVGFYERLGFEVTWEEAPAPGAPTIQGMWRAPSG